jgi:hypothetical protein
MSFLAMSVVDTALPVLQTFDGTVFGLARPILGIGALAGLMILFRPLLVGVVRAGLLLLRPRKSHRERLLHRNMKAALRMYRMARDVDSSHPSFAAELRSIAARG